MTEFGTPWERFYLDAKEAVESIIVSHKPTSKLISKAINNYYKWKEVEPGKWEKKIHSQAAPKDDDKYWVAVRQSLFGQPLGKVYIAEYKKGLTVKAAVKAQIQFLNRTNKDWNTEDWRIAKSAIRKQIDLLIKEFNGDEKAVLKYLLNNPLRDSQENEIEKLDLLQFKVYASKRVAIDESFTKDKIDNMPYSELQKNWLTQLLKQHLSEYNNDPKLAFKGEALEMLYRKAPNPINKVTRKEGGKKIEKNNKLFDGDAGVNQYFIIEIKKEPAKKTGEVTSVRKFSTPNFLDCIERLAKGLPVHDEDPNSQYIVLSPGDLIFVPEENENINQIDWNNYKKVANRIYLMKSSEETKCYFLPAYVASLISKYDAKTKEGEFESTNKSERTIDGNQIIKQTCIKLQIDRLGNIKPFQ